MSGSNTSLPDGQNANAPDQVLFLTVHTPVAPSLAAMEEAQRTRLGRLKMFLVLAVCAAPVLASYFTHYVIRPTGKPSYGELTVPQRELPPKLAHLRAQWLLVSVGSGQCALACQDHLYLQRQMREALGADKNRLDCVWLVTDDAPLSPVVARAVKEATALRVPTAELAQWLSPAPGQSLDAHSYVVDPQGNWMMRFPAGLNRDTAAQARRDVQRLLRASKAWDTAGR